MAEQSLNSILDDINTQIKTVSFGGKITTWNLAYSQEKDGKVFPLVNNGNRNGHKISWDDKYPLQTYHRIISSENETDTSLGFGSKPYRRREYQMRLVGIGSKLKLSAASYEDNQEICKAVSDALPSFLSGTEFVEVTGQEVIKQNVYDEEFKDTKMKHLSLEGIAFWIEYTLKIQVC